MARGLPSLYFLAEPRFSPRTLHAIAASFAGGSAAVLVGRALARAVVAEMRALRA